MDQLRFGSIDEAEGYLRNEGFAFQGAPDHWRRREGATVIRADIMPSGGDATVVFLAGLDRQSPEE